MRHLTLPDGTPLPALGLGTWRMGESSRSRATEVAAIRHALDLGYRLIDTAEMYGEGGAEAVVGQAVAEALRAGDVTRDELFIVSKVYPHNASRRGTVQACERSLQRLGLDRIDLYLLHWRGQHSLRDTVDAMVALRNDGRIAHWGVSNFDTDDMQELLALGEGCAANQVYYSLTERGVEFSLLPWMRQHAMPLMAYSPIDQGSLAHHGALAEVAQARGCTPAQVALAWVLQQPGVVAIPKAVSPKHQQDNLAALHITLSEAELQQLDQHFPGPRRKGPLAMV